MRYRARVDGHPAPDTLLIQLRDLPDRPVAWLVLSNPVTDLDRHLDLCCAHTIVSDDDPRPTMHGDVELDDGRMLSQVAGLQ